jgi:hypothetical protein
MTDTQLYLVIGVPVVSNAVMLLVFGAMFNSRVKELCDRVDTEIRRVEEVLSARLKHIEEM